jgi:type VII secretion-associated serine protease mycosin
VAWHGGRLIAAAIVFTATGLVPSAFDWSGPVAVHDWYLRAVHDERRVAGTGAGVTVAVIDSGVDTTHPDLRGHVLPVVCVDGCFLDRHGDVSGHGTAVASVIVGQGGGSQHVQGVAPGARVLPVRIDSSSQQTLADAIRYAADHASVITLSVGPPETPQPVLIDAVRYAQRRDAVVVAATGNLSGAQRVVKPANIPGVVAVTGISLGGEPWSGATTGLQVALAAPAEFIVGANSRHGLEGVERWPIPASDYLAGSGTSYAAPIVAGVAALVRSRYPHLDAGNVIQRLIATADHPGSAGRTSSYGYGVVNADRAVTAAVPPVASNPLLTAPPATKIGPEARRAPHPSWLSRHFPPLTPLDWFVVRGVPTVVAYFVVKGAMACWLWLWRRRHRRPAAALPTSPTDAVAGHQVAGDVIVHSGRDA